MSITITPAFALSDVDDVLTSMGIDLANRPFTGDNIQVAIIDTSFCLDDITANVIFFRDYTNDSDLQGNSLCLADNSDSTTSGFSHGTRVAEVVSQTAPDADLYLYKIGPPTPEDFYILAAADAAFFQNVDLIISSVGFNVPNLYVLENSTFMEGASAVSETAVANAVANAGIPFIQATGNAGTSFWTGDFTDSGFNLNNQITHQFQDLGSIQSACLPITVPSNEIDAIILRWDGWPNRSYEYDLYLYDSGLQNVITTATNTQNNFPQSVLNTPQNSSTTSYCLVVAADQIQPSDNIYIEFFRVTHADDEINFPPYELISDPNLRTQERTLGTPADAVGVLGVGAANFDTKTMEVFSSRGPTADERSQPQVCSYDDFKIFPQDSAGHPGTSFATPLVGGITAMLLEEDSTRTPSQINQIISDKASKDDIHDMDNVCGAGLAQFLRDPPTATATANPTQATEGNTVALDGAASQSNPTGFGSIVSYEWSQQLTADFPNGDEIIFVTGPDIVDPIIQLPQISVSSGVAAMQLKVTDDLNVTSMNVVTITVLDDSNSSPSPPTNPSANPISFNQIDLSWTAPTDDGGSPITGYRIERESPPGDGFVPLVSNTNSTNTTYSDSDNLSSGTQYNYKISAINAIGIGPSSVIASATTPALPDPISHHTFDDTTDDSTANNNDGTVTGTTDYEAPGVVGTKSFEFDGNTKITLANESNFDFDKTDSFSISAWIYPTTTDIGTEIIVSKMVQGGTYKGFNFFLDNSNRLTFSFVSDWTAAPNKDAIKERTIEPIPHDQWSHVVATYDGSQSVDGMTLYIDDVLQPTVTQEDNLTGSTLQDISVIIGSRNTVHEFTGFMDDVKIFDVELDSSDVSALFAEGTLPPPPAGPLISHHPFDGTLSDSAGNGSDGIVTGDTQYAAGKIGTQSFDFDGNTKITLEKEINFDFDKTDSFSISAWIHPTTPAGSGTTEIIVSKMPQGGTYKGFNFFLDNSNRLTFSFVSDWTVTPKDGIKIRTDNANAIPHNQWSHVVATYDGTSTTDGMKLYIDNVLQDSVPIEAFDLSGSTLQDVLVTIGSRNTIHEFTGFMDDVKIFNTELTASQVSDLFDEGQ